MTDTQLTQEQYELFKNAEERMKQKRLLYIHFFVFVLGTIFFWVANKLLGYGADYNWWYWAALIWLFLWLWHAMSVFVFNRFMGKEWEEKQREKLIAAQQEKIMKMGVAIEKELEKKREEVARQIETEQNKSETV